MMTGCFFHDLVWLGKRSCRVLLNCSVFRLLLFALLLALNFGLRSSMGFFMAPISNQFGYGREVFAFALALQNLWWGLSQPIAGRLPIVLVPLKTIWIGAVLYALGLYVTATADGVFGLNMGAGF